MQMSSHSFLPSVVNLIQQMLAFQCKQHACRSKAVIIYLNPLNRKVDMKGVPWQAG